MSARTAVKSVFAVTGVLDRRRPVGASLLIWHRVGGGTGDELDTEQHQFEAQLDSLLTSGLGPVPLDGALDRIGAGDGTPSVVLTFDDGFADVYEHAWPRLRERRLPFTIYLAAGLIGGAMRWEGSVARSQGALALDWDQLAEMHESGLLTVGNHTWSHARPEATDAAELDRCSDAIAAHLGADARPRHFAWTWGIEAPGRRSLVEDRFRSAATGRVGRNEPGCDPFALRRIPVRRSDPISFFRAKLRGHLVGERLYGAAVGAAKAVRRD